MKRPTWITIIGVLAIIFGIFGILGGTKHMAMPYMLEMQKEMMSSFSQGETPDGESAPKISWEVEKDGETQKIEMSHMFEKMEKQFTFPEWYKSWSIVIGIISMLLAGLYLLSGMFLLMTKPFATKLFYIAIGSSILWAIIQSAIVIQTDSLMLMAQIPGAIASIVIDVILLIVVLTGSKEVFNQRCETV